MTFLCFQNIILSDVDKTMEFLEEMRDIANEYSRDDDQERLEK